MSYLLENRYKIAAMVGLAIIAIGAFGLLAGTYVPAIILALVIPGVMILLYGGFIWQWWRNQRGYQDRYTAQGQSFVNAQHLVRGALLLLASFVLYALLSAGYKELTGKESPTLIFTITVVFVIGVVQIVDYYESKDMVDYVNYKEKRHKNYVESLGKAENICMSCRRKMNPEDQVCSNCGYKRKEKQGSTEYVA